MFGAADAIKSMINQASVNEVIEMKIGKMYKDALEFMGTKRDKDILLRLLVNISSTRFATYLKGKYAVQ